MAVWSEAPPLTAVSHYCIGSNHIPGLACEKMASDLGLGGGFRGIL